MADLPSKADIAIIGAGALGCAIAWRLAEAGVRDIVVIEKAQITHGSTWHAAGLVGQYRSAEDLTRLMQTSVSLLEEIQAETPIDWHRVGSLRIASSAARWRELTDGATKAQRYGVDYRLVSAGEAARLFPGLSADGVHGAAHIPGDGYVDPSSLTMAYAARARRLGVRIIAGVTVVGAERSNRLITKLATNKGTIACGSVVLAAGVWARAMGAQLGLGIPVAALEHQYAVTEKRADQPRNLPALRDPDLNFYLKPEVGAMAIGGWEPATLPCYDSDVPTAFGRALLPENLDRLQPILEAAAHRIPLIAELGLKTIINGPIPVTPDGEPILGPACDVSPDADNVWLAVGFTSGIAASAGAGQVLARWIVDNRPPFPIPSLAPGRFGTAPVSTPDLHKAAIRAYAEYYALPHQYRQSNLSV